MKKGKIVYAVILIITVILGGCGKAKIINDVLDAHEATTMKNDGMWETRYNYATNDHINDTGKMIASVNVLKDMTEDEMMEVIDYWDTEVMADYDTNGKYCGRSKGEFTCYCVFYKGNTSEEICRFKTVNGKKVDITDDDEPIFPNPDMVTTEIVN